MRHRRKHPLRCRTGKRRVRRFSPFGTGSTAARRQNGSETVQRRREIGILLGLIGVFVVVTAWLARQGQEKQGVTTPTTYSVAPGGLRALYQLFGREGIPTERWERPLTQLPPRAGLLVMTEPMRRRLRNAETEALSAWVEQGGILLAIVSAPNSRDASVLAPPGDPPLDEDEAAPVTLSEYLENDAFFVSVETRKATPAKLAPDPVRTPFLEDVQTLNADQSTRLKRMESEDSPPPERDLGKVPNLRADSVAPSVPGEEKTLLHDAEGAYLVMRTNPQGGAMIVATEGILPDNAHAAEGDNALLFVNIALQCPPNRPLVLFDEYHQGYSSAGGESGRSLWSELGTAGHRLFWYGVTFLALLIYNANRRFGSARTLTPPTVRPTTEYIASMAGLYRRAHAPEIALEALYQDFLRDLRRRVEMPPDADIERVLSLSQSRFGGDIASLRTVLTRCEEIGQGGKSSEAELMRLAVHLDDYRRRASLA